MNTPCRTLYHRAFTLLEVLAVTAIIGVLAALALVGFRRLTVRAEIATCAQNMRTAGAMILLYAADNKGRLPGNIDVDQRPAWGNAISPYYNAAAGSNYSKSFRRCPTQEKVILALTGKSSVEQLHTNSRNNFAFNYCLGPTTSNTTNFRTIASIVRPARTLMFTEAGITPDPYHTVGQLDGYWLLRSALDANGQIQNGVHDGANTIVWCDGHVSRWENINRLVEAGSPYRSTGSEDAWTGN